ncbi:MAG TPA: hypothetical protein VN157_07305 [Caulobacter sp.]|nr:hypothetical protein [Caulobacter sp.]
MSWVLDPTVKDVMGLDDVALRELVRRLSEAEIRDRDLSAAAVLAGGHQNAKDEGIDVLVEGATNNGGYLPRLPLGFQVKATTMDKGDVDKEMRPKKVLRPSIIALGQRGGGYIIACGRENLTSSARAQRLRAMELAFGGCETPAPHFDFYDASRLADWARQYRGVGIWLLEKAGRSTRGWSPLENWSAVEEGLEPEYLIDETARLSVGAGSAPLEVVQGMDALRDALRTPRSVVRLLGQSGMGKTRLVQALFDDRVGQRPLPPEAAVYGDAGRPDMDVEPGAMAHALIEAGQSPILILDNCSTDMHGALATLARRPDAKFSLLTIDFDIGADQPDKTVVARLERGGDRLIMRLLRQRAPQLNEADIARVTEFSAGNTRIALALANTAVTSGSLANLEDAALVDRLFLKGRREYDAKLHQVARVASLVYAFYVEGDPEPGELATLAKLASCSEEDFLYKLGELLDRGLAQQRGKQRAILPPALAIHLAKDAVKRTTASRLFAAFDAAPPRLRTSFARQLGALHDQPGAVEVGELLLAPTQAVASPEREDKEAMQFLTYLAPLAPGRVLEILQAYVTRYGAAETIVYTNQAARQVTALLCQLAYEADLFDAAGQLLSQLVIGQDESRMIEALRPRFTQFFQLLRSGTEASPQHRFALLDKLLVRTDGPTRVLGLQALRAALRTHPDNHRSAEPFGARRRNHGWRPPDDEAVCAWFAAAFERCQALIAGSEPVQARTLLAKAYPELVYVTAIADQTVSVMSSVAKLGFWGEGWFAACDVLHHRKGAEQTDAMRACEAELRPKTMQERFDAFMRQRLWEWHDPNGEDTVSSWEDACSRARQVGVEAASAGGEGQTLIAVALSDAHVAGHHFGMGLSQAATDLDLAWSNLLKIARRVPRAELNASTIVGFVAGARKRSPGSVERWFETGLQDPLVASLLPWLEVESGEVDAAGVGRIIKVLSEGLVHEGVAKALSRLRPSADVPPDDLAALVDAVLAHGQPWTALQLLGVKRPKPDDKAWPEALRAAGRRILEVIPFVNDEGRSADYQLATLADRVVRGSEGEATAALLLTRAAERLQVEDDFWLHGLPNLLTIIAREHPRLLLDTYLARDWEAVRYKLDHLLKNYDDDDGSGFNLLASIPTELLMAWMKEDRLERGRRLAKLAPYFQNGEGDDFVWTPVAMALLAEIGADSEIGEILDRRLYTGASSGDHSFRYTRRLPMLRALTNHGDPAVRAWADDALQTMSNYIEQLRTQAGSAEPRFE